MKLEGLERSKGLIVQLPVCVHISGKTDQGLHEFDNLLGFYSFVLQFVSGKLIIFLNFWNSICIAVTHTDFKVDSRS